MRDLKCFKEGISKFNKKLNKNNWTFLATAFKILKFVWLWGIGVYKCFINICLKNKQS